MRADATTFVTRLPLAMATPIADVIVLDDDDDGGMPADLRSWLVRLRLLDGVPFAYLVADSTLLPQESIRFFYIDRRWTDAVVQGALSVGTVNSDDRTHLAAGYPAIRAELDREERNVRRASTDARVAGPTGPISGFLLRSQAVSGWPGLHVNAFTVGLGRDDPAQFPADATERMRLLRLERLAPAVLLCLFDGIPRTVHIEEPRQGVQFGFDATIDGNYIEATLRPRDKATFDYLPGDPITVPFRSGGAPGVVDIQQLERDLKARSASTGAGDGLDSAEYALQLIRFPFRQVFGDTEPGPVIGTVFKPTVSYAALTTAMFRTES